MKGFLSDMLEDAVTLHNSQLVQQGNGEMSVLWGIGTFIQQDRKYHVLRFLESI